MRGDRLSIELPLILTIGHFFEMTKTDAERAMEIYRTFTRQTEYIVAYLSVARQHEHHTRVPVPRLKHAPIHLTRQLEDYLKDPDFEIHRRQYIAEQDAKGKGGSSVGKVKGNTLEFPKTASSPPAANNPFPPSNGLGSKPAETVESKPQANKGPETDLIDFFESIEQNQTTMAVHPDPNIVAQQQQNAPAFQPSPFGLGVSTNPYQQQQPQLQQQQFQQPQVTGFYQQQPQQTQPHQPDFTGAGFGGFSPQAQQHSFQPSTLGTIPQSTVANFQTQGGFMPQQQQGLGVQPTGLQPAPTGQQSTNPFRQSMLPPQPTGLQSPPLSNLSSPITGGSPALNRQSTNPFARSPPVGSSPFNSGSNSPFQSQQQAAAPLQPAPTGTNPFARNASPLTDQNRPTTAGGALAPQPTGATNPFRQSAFVNHATGQGWQHNQQPIGGGLDQLPTQQVFPRPLQQTPWQQ